MLIPKDTTDSFEYNTNDKISAFDRKFAYLDYILDAVKNIEIQTFSFIIFDEDIDNMSINEFELYYNDVFKNELIPAIQYYINIDISVFDEEDIESKRHILKNVIKFFTTFLPYNYLKQYISSKNTENKYDALELIDDNIKKSLCDAIMNSKNEYGNFIKLMTNVKANLSTDKKKNKFDTMLTILDSNIGEKIKMNEFFNSVIQTSSTDSLIGLCKLYIKNDYANIA